MMIPIIDVQEEYADALRALLDKNTIARRRNLWGVLYRVITRAEAAEAEVARLTAERHQLHHDWSEARDEIDALRAQLDAGEGWRPIHETLPPLGEVVQVRGRGQYVSSAWDVDLDEWRPAPPQE